MDIQKNFLVTGATRGIGRAITEKLLSRGHRVYGVYKSSDDQAKILQETYSSSTYLFKADLADREQISKLIDNLQGVELAGIVNNAGIISFTDYENWNLDDWNATFAVNLAAPAILIHGLRANLHTGSAIVNIASVDGFYAAFNTIAYAASKAALISLTKSLGAILGPSGIRVNAIAPGWVETEMTKDSMPTESKELTPLQRNAQPAEIANVAEFLLSDKASFINGSVIVVDGGLTTVDYTLYQESRRDS